MGLFTPLDLEQARAIGAEFGIQVRAVEPLPQGSVNSNFRLLDEEGRKYFARIYEEQGSAGASAELTLLRELARAGVPTTEPLSPSRGGGGVPSIAGKPFALYPWIDGEILCQARVTADRCHAVGEALAGLHLATASVTPLAGGRFRVEDVKERLARVEKESPSHRDAALHVRRRLEHYAARRQPSLPAGVIHGDLFRDNVLWHEQRIAALIDFESASQGAFAFDLMVTVLAWCYGDALDAELVSAMLIGYARRRPLAPAEIDSLVTEGALACLRFATTRITDFSMRTPPGQAPLRDYRRFLARLEALEHGALEPALTALRRGLESS
jgi:homoserine kinase type II